MFYMIITVGIIAKALNKRSKRQLAQQQAINHITDNINHYVDSLKSEQQKYRFTSNTSIADVPAPPSSIIVDSKDRVL